MKHFTLPPLFTFPVSLAAAVAFLGWTNASQAQSVTVPNFSFETPVTSGFQDNSGISSGSALPNMGNSWYYLGGFVGNGSPVGVQNANANGGFTAPDGTQDGYVNNGAWLGSTSLTAIQANTAYTLTVAEGNRGGGFAQSAGFTIALAYGSSAGDAALASSGNWGNSLHVDYANSPAVGAFADYTVSFTTGASDSAIGQSLFVVLGSDATTAASGVNPIDYDNVRLTAAAVPEPTSLALLLGGLTLLVVRRRRS